MPLFMGVYCLGGTQGDDAPHGGRGSIAHLRPAATRESSDRSLSYRAYAITARNSPLDIGLPR